MALSTSSGPSVCAHDPLGFVNEAGPLALYAICSNVCASQVPLSSADHVTADAELVSPCRSSFLDEGAGPLTLTSICI